MRRKRVFVMALRIEFVPRNDTTMSLLVESVATKPVTSVRRELEDHGVSHYEILKAH